MKVMRPILLMGVVLFETNCGLPDTYYLQPPVAGTLANGILNSSFTIIGSTRSNDVNVTFSGYELYYKCYPDDTTSMSADLNYGPSNKYTDLLSAGFFRVCRGPGSGGLPVDTGPGVGNAPLINIQQIDSSSIGSTFTVNIIMNNYISPPSFGFTTLYGTTQLPVTYFQYCPPSTPSTPTAGYEIRRYMQANSLLGFVCKPFTSNFYYPFANWSLSDNDATNLSLPLGGSGNVYIMIYACAYGVGIDGIFQESSPALLGNTLIQVINQYNS
jgi:hypothetical protein